MTRTRSARPRPARGSGAAGAPPGHAPAQATSTYLCTGYDGCKDDGLLQLRLQRPTAQDVLADVLRPQLHQLRRLPDGQDAACRTSARGAAAATPQLGPAIPEITDQHARWSARSRGGRPTSPAPAPPATSRTSSGSSPRPRSSSPRTAGAATSTGGRSPSAAPAGPRASSTSTTARSATPDARHHAARPRSATPLTVSAGRLEPRARRSRTSGSPDGEPIAGATDGDVHADARRARPQRSRSGSPPPSAASSPGRRRRRDHGPVAAGTLASTAAPDDHRHAARRRGADRRAGPWSPQRRATTIRWYADGEPISGATGRACASPRS